MNNFDLKAYMDVTPEIEEAVRTGKPVVALESTILSHGMPYPENLSFAREVEKIIREQGAIPATMAIIDGRLKCGLTEAELVRMCEAKGVLKVSRRDLPIVVAQKLTGATTVATTIAARIPSREIPVINSMTKKPITKSSSNMVLSHAFPNDTAIITRIMPTITRCS